MEKSNPQDKPDHPSENPAESALRPYVVVEVLLEGEWLWLAVRNIGQRPAVDVQVVWEPRFRGLGGAQAVAELPLFRDLSYLGPDREIRTLLDTRQAYFQRGEPTRLVAHIQYRDEQGRRFQNTLRHNLEIFRDLSLPAGGRPGQEY